MVSHVSPTLTNRATMCRLCDVSFIVRTRVVAIASRWLIAETFSVFADIFTSSRAHMKRNSRSQQRLHIVNINHQCISLPASLSYLSTSTKLNLRLLHSFSQNFSTMKGAAVYAIVLSSLVAFALAGPVTWDGNNDWPGRKLSK